MLTEVGHLFLLEMALNIQEKGCFDSENHRRLQKVKNMKYIWCQKCFAYT